MRSVHTLTLPPQQHHRLKGNNTMNNILANNAHQARTRIGIINTALTDAGLDPIPNPDTSSIPKVTTPTAEEITTALLNTKGDPGNDKTLQALATRAWLAQHAAPQTLEDQAWIDHWQHFTHEQAPALLATIRDQYEETGTHLATAATGPLRGYRTLSDINLSTLPTPIARVAADVIPHYRHAAALHRAWRSISAVLGTAQSGHWSEQAAPTLEQYTEARDATPQTFPANDPWAIALKGWKLELAANFADAQNRRNTLNEHANNAEDQQRATSRRRGLMGGYALN